VSKLSDSEGEAAETQVWFDFALCCQYIDAPVHKILIENYDQVIGKLVNMSLHPENWTF